MSFNDSNLSVCKLSTSTVAMVGKAGQPQKLLNYKIETQYWQLY